jgi:hypothetical protein
MRLGIEVVMLTVLNDIPSFDNCTFVARGPAPTNIENDGIQIKLLICVGDENATCDVHVIPS